MNITVDLDDVLGHYMQGFLDFYNAEHGTRFLKKELTTYSLSLHLAEPESRIGPLVDKFALTPEYAGLPVMSGAYAALQRLKKEGHDLSVLTSRKKETRFVTEHWLDQNYAGIFF